MEEADQLCDRVAIMDHGRILALDTPAAAQAVDRAPASIVKVTDRPRPTPTASAATSSTPIDEATDYRLVDGAVLLSASGTGLLPRIVTAAEQIDVTVTDLSVSDPTLETVFINLTGKDLRE